VEPILQTSSEAAAVIRQKRLRILYADDMRELREVLALTLSRCGHAIECVPDGVEALQRLTLDPAGFDLLITDHHMPRMNGLELVTAVRAMPFAGKVLVFCSELSREVNTRYVNLGVDRILYKPVVPAELRAALAEI